jgi:predicted GNAT superfamily acetyltransferase
VSTVGVLIRELTPDDLTVCVELNNGAVPAVSEASAEKLSRLVEMSTVSLVACAMDGPVIGFCVNFGPGTEYGSVNYRWFSERYDAFTYLDRIVVAPAARNLGIGAALYAAVEERIDSPWLLCEVNLRPRNDGSLRFHERIGFVEVGQQETDYGILVSMLAKDLR